MSTQTVYFNNPATIVDLQQTVTSMSGAVDLLNQINGTTTIMNGTDAQTKVQTWCNSQLAASSAGSTTAGDRYGTGSFNWFAIYGNAFSNQEYFTSSGRVSAATGTAPTQNNYAAVASCSKKILPLGIAKCLEEGYFKTSDLVKTYIPEFSGTGYYYIKSTCTGAFCTTSSLANLTTWTGTLGSFDLGAVTVAQVLGLQLSSIYPLAFLGAFNVRWATVPTITSQQNAGDIIDWGFNLAAKDTRDCLTQGLIVGSTASQTGGASFGSAIREYQYSKYFGDANTVYGYESDYLYSVIACCKSGKAPWVFAPGDGILSPNSIFSTRSMYSKINWTVLTAIASSAIRKRQGSLTPYRNVADYITAKILNPMGISLWYAGYEPPVTGAVVIESTFRRNATYQNASNWVSTGCSPSYTGAYTNSLAWASQFPDDGIARLDNTTEWAGFTDPVGPAYEGRAIIRISDFPKIGRLFINKGVHIDKVTGQKTRILSTASVNFLFNNSTAPSDTFEAYGGFSRETGNYRFTIGGFAKIDDSFSHVSQQLITNQATFPTIPYPLSENTCTWQGSTNVADFFDLSTGYYGLSGTQFFSGGNSATPDAATVPEPLYSRIVGL